MKWPKLQKFGGQSKLVIEESSDGEDSFFKVFLSENESSSESEVSFYKVFMSENESFQSSDVDSLESYKMGVGDRKFKC